MSGDVSAIEPPDSIPNSEVKYRGAHGSVRYPHVRVGNCQAYFVCYTVFVGN